MSCIINEHMHCNILPKLGTLIFIISLDVCTRSIINICMATRYICTATHLLKTHYFALFGELIKKI